MLHGDQAQVHNMVQLCQFLNYLSEAQKMAYEKMIAVSRASGAQANCKQKYTFTLFLRNGGLKKTSHFYWWKNVL